MVVGAVLLLAVTSCGEDDATSSTPAVPTTLAPSTATPPEVGSAGPTPSVTDACAIVPAPEVASATDLPVDDGVPAGDERRRVCTFQVADPAVGITVGVETGGRFDEKTEASRRSLGVQGDEIDDLGDAARFFFSDEDLPEGVGGVLVAVGDLTIDVTLQGLDEAVLRRDAVAIAELAVSNL